MILLGLMASACQAAHGLAGARGHCLLPGGHNTQVMSHHLRGGDVHALGFNELLGGISCCHQPGQGLLCALCGLRVLCGHLHLHGLCRSEPHTQSQKGEGQGLVTS